MEDTSELAQADDSVNIPLKITGQRFEDGKWTSYRVEVSADTTWDDLFGDIGPTMIDEATEKAVRERAELHAFAAVDDETSELLKGWRSVGASIYDEDWDMIRVQFRALGLNDNGQKKRQINDRNKYLALTDKGDRHLTYLRAIRRDEESTNSGRVPPAPTV